MIPNDTRQRRQATLVRFMVLASLGLVVSPTLAARQTPVQELQSPATRVVVEQSQPGRTRAYPLPQPTYPQTQNLPTRNPQTRNPQTRNPRASQGYAPNPDGGWQYDRPQPGYQPAANPPLPFPGPGDQYTIPPSGYTENIRIEVENGLVSLVARNALLRDVLSLLADRHRINIVMMVDSSETISLTLNEVLLDDALTAVLSIAGYTWTTHNGIVHVTSIASNQVLNPNVQGRIVRVFELDYVSAIDLDAAVQGMLSPVGSSQVIVSSPLDNRRTSESIVVEDYPQFMNRIEQYIRQLDVPPRQVLIQVHVMEISLDHNERHGVNFESLMQWGGADIRINTVGFANAVASPAFFASIDSEEVDGLLEAIESETDSRTLAAPQVIALNGQESRLQVGEQLGYRTTTTTETSTQENIQFLDVGVVLTVVPRISRDNHVLMHLKPEVSSGEVNDTTGLPRETTSEVETNVLLSNGQAVIIGGLIQEKDTRSVSKIPRLGDIQAVKHLFRRHSATTERSEIVFILTPHVVEPCYDPGVAGDDPGVWSMQNGPQQAPLNAVNHDHANSAPAAGFPTTSGFPANRQDARQVPYPSVPPAPVHPAQFPGQGYRDDRQPVREYPVTGQIRRAPLHHATNGYQAPFPNTGLAVSGGQVSATLSDQYDRGPGNHPGRQAGYHSPQPAGRTQSRQPASAPRQVRRDDQVRAASHQAAVETGFASPQGTDANRANRIFGTEAVPRANSPSLTPGTQGRARPPAAGNRNPAERGGSRTTRGRESYPQSRSRKRSD